MIGIYCWTNRLNGKQYVGQSIDIERRKKQHLYAMKNQEDSALYRAMRKDGIENFIFSVLEESSVEELDIKERFWIAQLDSYNKGYNENSGGQFDQCGIGEENGRATFTNIEVLNIRNRVYLQHEEPLDLYNKEYFDRCSYSRFWSMVHGDTWKNVDTSMIYQRKANVTGEKNPRARLTDQDVINIRRRKYLEGESTKTIFQDYKDKISFSAFEKIALGSTWKHIPIPKRITKESK